MEDLFLEKGSVREGRSGDERVCQRSGDLRESIVVIKLTLKLLISSNTVRLVKVGDS